MSSSIFKIFEVVFHSKNCWCHVPLKPLSFQVESSCLDLFNCHDQPQLQLSWAELSLFSSPPGSRPTGCLEYSWISRKSSQPVLFSSKWMTTSNFCNVKCNLIFCWPQLFNIMEDNLHFLIQWKMTSTFQHNKRQLSLFNTMEDDLHFSK